MFTKSGIADAKACFDGSSFAPGGAGDCDRSAVLLFGVPELVLVAAGLSENGRQRLGI